MENETTTPPADHKFVLAFPREHLTISFPTLKALKRFKAEHTTNKNGQLVLLHGQKNFIQYFWDEPFIY